jgi:hypothetical protein
MHATAKTMRTPVEQRIVRVAHLAQACVLISCVCAALQPAAAQEPAPSKPRFIVFDSIRNRGKPALESFGLVKLTPVFGPHWAKPGTDPGNLDEAAVLQSIETSVRPSGAPAAVRGTEYSNAAFLDIENLPIYGVPVSRADAHVARLVRIAQLAKATRPQARFGFYGVLPVRLFGPLIAGDQRTMGRWHEANQRAERIAQYVDFIFPSLYTLDEDPEHWEVFAKAMIAEARRYNRPVYPFIWPLYHDSNPRLRGKPLPATFWRQQLEFCWRYADGVVIWGSAHDDWHDDAPWWVQTQEFLRSHGLAGEHALERIQKRGAAH